jgi:hypothetical protein
VAERWPGKHAVGRITAEKANKKINRSTGGDGTTSMVLKVAEFGYGIGEAIGARGCGGTCNDAEMRTSKLF